MIIAVDGTVASGKGTLSRRLAVHYGVPHLDTGTLYRATAVAALAAGVDLADEAACAAIARALDLDRVDDQALRTAEAGQAASKVAALPAVRAALLAYQRDFAARPGGALVDGRDIGTVVCPEADVKLWIDAAVEERARRRAAELRARGDAVTDADMLADLIARDKRDRERALSPAKPADDAVLIDTTDLPIDAVVDKARAVIDAARARRFSRP